MRALRFASLHLCSASTELNGTFLFCCDLLHAQLPRQQSQRSLSGFQKLRRIFTIDHLRHAKVAFCRYWKIKRERNEVLIEIWEANFLAGAADYSIVTTEIALAQSVEVELEFFN
jgi:hypothetical protein